MSASSVAGKNPAPTTPLEVFRTAERELAAALPRGWFVHGQYGVASRSETDAVLSIRPPTSDDVTFEVELKASPKRRDLFGILGNQGHDLHPPSANTLLIARFLSPQIREELQHQKISFLDATGNIFIHSVDPIILISQDGAKSDPWRGPGRPTGSLKGLPAARLVRALADFRPPYNPSELAQLSGASIGATYRLIDFLTDEMLIERDGTLIRRADWASLLRRWSLDAGVVKPVSTGYIEPRGLSEIRRKLRATDPQEYVLTGSLAAEPYSQYAEARLATLYSDNPHDLGVQLGWRPTDSGANVIVMSPRSSVVFDRASEADGLHVVAPSQAAADLLNGPGRQPAEGEALLEWMGAHEDDWRR
jgi:hypothetical protein